MVQGPEAAPVARSAEAGLKSRGSAWPGLLTCCGRRDGSRAFEGSKVSETQHGEGPGSGCVVSGCDLVLTNRCWVTGTRGCALCVGCGRHQAQLLTALDCTVAFAGCWLAAGSRQESWEEQRSTSVPRKCKMASKLKAPSPFK